MEINLHDLGLKHGTDKTVHGFTPDYDKHLSHLRNEKLEFLEIGLWEGASIAMWHDYFKNANIHGADILDCSRFDNERITTYIVNQENESSLRSLPKNFDIILDDGGHTMLQQQLTLKVMFLDHLKEGGLFIIEDLHTSGPAYSGSHGSTAANNTLQLLKDLKSGTLSEYNKYYITAVDFNNIKEQIKEIEIIDLGEHHITSIIKKK